MNRAKLENRTKGGKIYYESHHILPNFMFKDRKGRTGPNGHLDGDCDNKNNLVLLTIREHFLAHVLLTKIYAGTRYEPSAKKSLVWFFTVLEKSSHPRDEWYNLSRSKKYEKYRELAIQSIRDSMIGTMLVKDSITGEKIGRVSIQHQRVLLGEWVHWSTGRKNTEEQTKATSKRMSGPGNPNAKNNITKQIIVDAVVKHVIENNKGGTYISRKEIDQALKQDLNISVSIMKQRFTNGRTELLKEVNAELTNRKLAEVKYDPYHRSAEQKKKLSLASLTHRWVTDGVVNMRLIHEQLDKFLRDNKTYRRGRTT
jgi:hypothetical protein